MGNAGCCNAEREERLQMDNAIAGANPEGAQRGALKGAGQGGSFKESSIKQSSQPVEKEFVSKNHSGNTPTGSAPQDKMFNLSSEAQTTLDQFGVFKNAANRPNGEMTGPYKITADSFNVNYFIPAITNNQIDSSKVKENDTTYFGQVNSSGKRDGYGIITTSDGHHFSGLFQNDIPTGEGRLIFNNGDFLIGIFKGNVIDGKGELHFLSKETVFNGLFQNNMPNGQGQLNSTSGDAGYTGDWKNGAKHGFGTEKWEDGTIYEGNFFEGQKHGNGKFSWPDGATYEGQFKYNAIHGLGTHTWGDGRIFIGGWKDNKMHGNSIQN